MKFPRETLPIGDCLAVKLNGNNTKMEREDQGRYRHTHVDGERWSNHRLSFHLNKQPISRKPDNLRQGLVLHTCDHKWCVNPDHLYLGTQAQNIRDLFDRNQEYCERNKLINVGKGHPHTEESKAKIGRANKGQRRTPEQRAKMSEGQRRRKHTPESKARISAAFARRREQSA